MLFPDAWFGLCKIGVEPTAEYMRVILGKKTSFTFGVLPLNDESSEFEEVMFYPKLTTYGPGEHFHGVAIAMNGDVWAADVIHHHESGEQSTMHVLYKLPEGATMLNWNEA